MFTMSMGLLNRVIVVTGGNGLIGKAIIESIRNAGGVGISADLFDKTDFDTFSIRCDITNEQSIQVALESIYEKFGRIDGIVNSAYPRTKDWGNRFEEISVESWRKNCEYQLDSCFMVCQKSIPYLKANKGSAIVNIGSTYGVVGPDFTVYKDTSLTSPAAYSAIKGGIINFTKYLASYFGQYGIRVNCVSPGGIFDNQDQTFVKNYEEKVPMRRMGRPEDIGGPVTFLLSEEASYITGHNLMVDGGWTCI